MSFTKKICSVEIIDEDSMEGYEPPTPSGNFPEGHVFSEEDFEVLLHDLTSNTVAISPLRSPQHSDDDNDFVFAAPHPVRESSSTPLQPSPSTSFNSNRFRKSCSYIIKKGARKNLRCGGKIKMGYQFCSKHIGKDRVKKQTDSQSKSTSILKQQSFGTQTDVGTHTDIGTQTDPEICMSLGIQTDPEILLSCGIQTDSQICMSRGIQTSPQDLTGAINYKKRQMIPNRHYKLETYFDRHVIISFTEFSGRITYFRLFLPTDMERKNPNENWYLAVKEKNGDLLWLQK